MAASLPAKLLRHLPFFKNGSLVGFAQLPAGVSFHCPACKYVKDGICQHKDPDVHGKHVDATNCCNFFDHTGMKVLA